MKKFKNVDKKIKSKKAGWKFNKSVAKNFNSHVTKSVPFYKISHDLVEKFSDFFIKNNSNIYDLGCSTGLLAQKIYKSHNDKNINLTAIDYSKHMIDQIKIHQILKVNDDKDLVLVNLQNKHLIYVKHYRVNVINSTIITIIITMVTVIATTM